MLETIKAFYYVPELLEKIDIPVVYKEWKLIPLEVDRPRKWRYPTLANKENVQQYDPTQPRAHDFPKKRKHRRGKRRHQQTTTTDGSGGDLCRDIK